MQLMVALKPIHDAAGIDRLIVSTYQSVSGTGVKAVEELEDQTRARARTASRCRSADGLPAPIAFNVLGGAGNFAEGDDHTDEERKMMFETRKILGDEEHRDRGHLRARARAQLALGVGQRWRPARTSRVEEARELLAGMPGLDAGRRPGARTATRRRSSAAGRDEVFVGRLRRDPTHQRGLQMWVVSDNLLKGAATNAVQIAEVLHERGLVRVSTAA